MNPGNYFIPNTYRMMQMPTNAIMSNMVKRPSVIGRFAKSITGVNWGNLLTNTNKTLNVVNQTIPLVKQAKPMVSNMRNMLRIAKAFGQETTKNFNNKINNTNSFNNNQNNKTNYNNQNSTTKKDISYNQTDINTLPNFFV